ncbi:hypothetical protein V1264_018962 [Littorina saxatilis]|uniref:CUB domain-containing protein n=1 Tax=Littorina saxatilis TaxID=31220 RepID=A0AAN9BE69_9CAEN
MQACLMPEVEFFNILTVTDRAAGQCDGVARQLLASVNESKELTSPGYPWTYSSDSGCRWQIDTGSAGGIVRVYIYDVRLNEEDSCTPSNSLTLIDGLNPGTLLARLCKREDIKDTYQSSGPYMQVLFYTGANTHGRSGFYLSYFAVVKETSTRRFSNANVTNVPAQDNDNDTYNTQTQVILGVIGSAAGLLIIISIACTCICHQKQNTQRGVSREERPNTQRSDSRENIPNSHIMDIPVFANASEVFHRNRSRIDDAQTAVREGNGNVHTTNIPVSADVQAAYNCFISSRRGAQTAVREGNGNVHTTNIPVFTDVQAAFHSYRSRMDDAQTPVRDGNGNAAYFSSREDNLPPDYSDLAISSDGLATETAASLNPSVGERAGVDIAGGGGGGSSHGGGSLVAGGSEGGGEGGGLSREEPTVSTPPPVYDSSMIELFPPQTLPPTSSGDHEQAVAYESQCSVPPPTTGSPPPPLTPESSSLSPMRFA